MSELSDFISLRPAGGFGMIMADPPWLFANWSMSGEHKNAAAKYSCTPLDWIKGLPVSVLAAEDCLLWLWATNPMLREAIEALLPDVMRIELFSRQRRPGWRSWGNQVDHFNEAAG